MSNERYRRYERMLSAVDGLGGLAVVASLAKSFPDFARYLIEFPLCGYARQ